MLYIICQEGINDNDRRKLLDCAKLSLEESQAIGNLANMGVRLVPYIDSSEKKAAQELRVKILSQMSFTVVIESPPSSVTSFRLGTILV